MSTPINPYQPLINYPPSPKSSRPSLLAAIGLGIFGGGLIGATGGAAAGIVVSAIGILVEGEIPPANFLMASIVLALALSILNAVAGAIVGGLLGAVFGAFNHFGLALTVVSAIAMSLVSTGLATFVAFSLFGLPASRRSEIEAVGMGTIVSLFAGIGGLCGCWFASGLRRSLSKHALECSDGEDER